jgi:hypothetical protein
MQTIHAAVTAVEREWSKQLGTEDVELLRTLLTRLAVIVGPAGTELAGSSPPPTTKSDPAR